MSRRWLAALALAFALVGCGEDVELGTDPRSDAAAGLVDAGTGG